MRAVSESDLDVMPGPEVAAGPSRLRRRVTAIVVVLVIAALAWALIQGWDKVSKYDWDLRPSWLGLGAVLIMLAYATNANVYSRSVEWLSPVHAPRRVAVSIWARSILARYIPGNVMMIVGRAVLSHDHGVSRRVTLAATLYEQALALGIGSIGAVLYLALYGDPGEGRLLWLLLVVPVVMFCLHPKPFRFLSSWALRKLGRPPIETLFSGRQVFTLLGLYAAGTLPLMFGVWAIVRAGVGADAGGPFEVGLAFLLSFVISFLAFVLPSGIGVRDGIFALALTQHLPGGVALAVAVGLRLVMVAIELVFVGLAVLVGRK